MILVGIDDTDNPESRGTGYLARKLGALVAASGIARLHEITRHQLMFDRCIPYTSHNSALCMRVEVQSGGISALAATCRSYLLKHNAVGSNVGLCIATSSDVPPVVEDFGFKAKKEILTQDRACELARCEGLLLEGLTGDHGGVIGALAAVGLRKSGRDGRIGWRPGLRETRGIVTAAHLLSHSGIDAIRRIHTGEPVGMSDLISVNPWPRSVMIDGQAVLLVEPTENPNDQCQWQLVPKDILLEFSGWAIGDRRLPR
ncbi:hypothetical protein [Nitrobacter winogradskyi]|uniref:Uncharacterized protein n=2 Tax=Nitrobacter winogradskyi TaxID=913 RepID=A0ACC6ALM9_NITWI|nr:hypothetical protein [Nitrobacter winogradskyi]MCP2000758.1 hypothetical protein [Nitrobacter winogradskyi]